MNVHPDHHIHLENGQFAETTAEDLARAFDKLEKATPANGIVIHFHGGLNSRDVALKTATVLKPKYEEADAYPLFFIWESGFGETVRNNLRDITQEPFFRQLIAKLAGYLARKLRIQLQPNWLGETAGFRPEAFGTPEELVGETIQPVMVSESTAESLVQQWFRRTEGNQSEDPLLPPSASSAGKILFEGEISEEELAEIFERDSSFQSNYQHLANRANAEEAVTHVMAESTTGMRAGDTHLDPRAKQELFGSTAAEGLDPVSELSFSGAYWAAKVAKVGAAIGWRTIDRFRNQRDHGFLTTLIEETLRQLYADAIGRSFFWNQMKKDTVDAMGDDPSRHGGTALLKQLIELHDRTGHVPRITLVGHSAGAIFVANFLLAAHRELPADVKFDVILLAPAVDTELFHQAMQTKRVAAIRMFAMSDELECRDALLASTSSVLRWVYPKSLLYFVSGLLESEVDRPLLGMQRFYDTQVFPDSKFPELGQARSMLVPYPDRLVWSIDQGEPGRRSASTRHGDFDREDSETLGSVLHIIQHGFDPLPLDFESNPPQVAKLDPVLEDASEAVRQYRVGFNRNPDRNMVNLDYASEGMSMVEATEVAVEPKHQVLVEVDSPECSLSDVEGVEVLSRVGRIVACRATNFGVRQLKANQRVRAIDAAGGPGHVECHRSMPFVGVVSSQGERLQEHGEGTIVAAIDSGFDVLHAAFRERDPSNADGPIVEKGRTRFLAIWDQDDPTGPPPPGLENAGGTLHTAADIDRYIQQNSVEKQLGQRAAAHGTHVLSIAAGTDLRHINDFPGGVAPNASLVGVISSTASDSEFEEGSPASIAYSISHLQALEFIGQVSEGTLGDSELDQQVFGALPGPPTVRPVVVNVSQGMNLGAHDGSSLLERTFDEFTGGGRNPGRVVVKSAGNNRSDALHAFVTLSSNQRETLTWDSDQGLGSRPTGLRQRPDVIELWFSSQHELTFALRSPNGNTGPVVRAGKHETFQLDGAQASVRYIRFDRDNSDSRVLVSLLDSTAFQFGDHRTWHLQITAGNLNGTVEIDAWIERQAQPRFPFPKFAGSHVSENRTISMPGTAQSIITVGAIEIGDFAQVASFSAYGGSRKLNDKPDVVAPGVGILAAQAGTGDQLVPFPGTSMAAPHVAGAIALAFAAAAQVGKRLSSNEIRGALRTNDWDRGMGFGPLDVPAFLQRLGLPSATPDPNDDATTHIA